MLYRVRSLGWEDPLEKGMATHFQYSCLEIFMDREAWCVTVHGNCKESDMTEQLILVLVYMIRSWDKMETFLDV